MLGAVGMLGAKVRFIQYYGAWIQVLKGCMFQYHRGGIEADLRCISDIMVVLFAQIVGCDLKDLLQREFSECLKITQRDNSTSSDS